MPKLHTLWRTLLEQQKMSTENSCLHSVIHWIKWRITSTKSSCQRVSISHILLMKLKLMSNSRKEACMFSFRLSRTLKSSSKKSGGIMMLKINSILIIMMRLSGIGLMVKIGKRKTKRSKMSLMKKLLWKEQRKITQESNEWISNLIFELYQIVNNIIPR